MAMAFITHKGIVGAMARAYLALGSNLGDRAGLLRAAVEQLQSAMIVEALSPIFETDAVADEPQPPYLNAVVRVDTVLAPRALLELGLAIERRLGRTRADAKKKSPRTIDVDILLYEDIALAEPDFRLPHPGLLLRPFVRIPLAAVALPGLRHPLSGEDLTRCAAHPGVRPFAPVLRGALGPKPC